MPNPSPKAVVLTGAEREQLRAWARRPSTAQALASRSRIVLACADDPDASNVDVGQTLSVHRMTVGKWHNRFVEHRLDGLLDEPRPGRPRTISDEDVERAAPGDRVQEIPADHRS